MNIHRTVSFDRQERMQIAAAACSVRIAFGIVPLAASGQADEWRSYPGRDLIALGTQKDAFSSQQVVGALEALRELDQVLMEESKVEYWRPHVSGPSLGADMAEVMAEIREHQLADVRKATVVVENALELVGGPTARAFEEVA